MAVLLVYGGPLLLITIWVLALRKYAQQNNLKKGFQELWRCLKTNLLIVIGTALIVWVQNMSMKGSGGSPEGSWAAGLGLIITMLIGAGLIVLVFIIWGCRAYVDAASIDPKSGTLSENDDILDDSF